MSLYHKSKRIIITTMVFIKNTRGCVNKTEIYRSLSYKQGIIRSTTAKNVVSQRVSDEGPYLL